MDSRLIGALGLAACIACKSTSPEQGMPWAIEADLVESCCKPTAAGA